MTLPHHSLRRLFMGRRRHPASHREARRPGGRMQEMVNVGTPKCVICGNVGIVRVPKEGVARYRAGEAIQVAFPTLDADQRELLMTGTHAHCWEILTGGEEE